jgi:protein phosphatase 2C family protein 2/3
MGQFLSNPNTAKETIYGGDQNCMYGVSSMQGWRVTMEDNHLVHCGSAADEFKVFAVFDGHRGTEASNLAAERLVTLILKHKSVHSDISLAIKEAYFSIDEEIRLLDVSKNTSGTTAISCIIHGNRLYTANVGDSRAILCRNGTAVALSIDHKPYLKSESDRIYRAGGYVTMERVNGTLALSRALGDLDFKQNHSVGREDQLVSSEAEITINELSPDDHFIVIACDGIWDVMSNEEVVAFVNEKFSQSIQPDKVCELLIDACLAKTIHDPGTDNMTVIIVCLFNESDPVSFGSRDLSTWYSKFREA